MAHALPKALNLPTVLRAMPGTQIPLSAIRGTQIPLSAIRGTEFLCSAIRRDWKNLSGLAFTASSALINIKLIDRKEAKQMGNDGLGGQVVGGIYPFATGRERLAP